MSIGNEYELRRGRALRGWSIRLACVALLLPLTAEAQQPNPRATVGAYYFDGWSGQTNHITELLKTEFADRKPVWGWKDDTIEIMRRQIDYCADHGIAFWSFCWYYPEGEDKTTPLNNALELYLKSPNSQRLKFCLLVANHGGFCIGTLSCPAWWWPHVRDRAAISPTWLVQVTRCSPVTTTAWAGLERERRRRILDADRDRWHQVPGGGEAGDQRGSLTTPLLPALAASNEIREGEEPCVTS